VRYIKFSILDFVFLLYWGPFRILMKRTPIFLRYWFADRVGSVLFLFSGKELVETCRSFCRICGHEFSEVQLRKTALEGLRLTIKKNLERLTMSSFQRKDADRMIVPEGLDHIDNALLNGKGAIIQVAHFGSFLLPVIYLGLLGYPVTQIAREIKKPHKSLFATFLNYIRTKDDGRLPIKFFYFKSMPKALVQKLRNNEVVAIAIDGRRAQHFIDVNFLGKNARLASGIVRLAALTGAPILPTFCVRQPDDTQKVIVEQAFSLEQKEDKDKMVKDNLERLIAITAEYVKKYPSHFFMNLRKKSKISVDVPIFSESDMSTNE
jgi:lauroyl/myristoyl acyltransferase